MRKVLKSIQMLYTNKSPKIVEVRQCRDYFRREKQPRRDNGKGGKNDGGKPPDSEESALMWDMLALEHESEPPPGVAATESNPSWSQMCYSMGVKDGRKVHLILTQC